MPETAKKIRWQPTSRRARFGKGLEDRAGLVHLAVGGSGARRSVWTNADGTDVQAFGSFAELRPRPAARSTARITRVGTLPRIDEIVFANAKGEKMRRIPEVFDCWFESGNMPYASAHYPAEGKAEFNAFPGRLHR